LGEKNPQLTAKTPGEKRFPTFTLAPPGGGGRGKGDEKFRGKVSDDDPDGGGGKRGRPEPFTRAIKGGGKKNQWGGGREPSRWGRW